MCLALIAFRAFRDYPVVIAANRDEFRSRPTAPADWWDDGILAGRDLQAGGTWMGISRSGRIALVTNFREGRAGSGTRSRGDLVVNFLLGQDDFLPRLREDASSYGGFSLVFGTADGLDYFSNRGMEATLTDGVHGVSNNLLDTPWPKVVRGTSLLSGARPDPQALLDMLQDTETAADGMLPETGVGIELERVLSPMFIRGEKYGTRASTVLLVDAEGRATFAERTFDAHGMTGERTFELEVPRPRREKEARP